MRPFKTISAVFLAILIFSFTSLQATAQVVTIQPKKPEAGRTVTITYHPDSPDAAIKYPDSLKLVFSTNPVTVGPYSVKMEKTSAGWVAKIPITDYTRFAGFYFKSGDKTDKNETDHQYTFYAYENGKPVKGAYFMEAMTLKGRYPDAPKNELSEIRAGIILKEAALYPDNFKAQMALYSYQLHQPFADSSAVLAKAHHRIKQKLAENPRSWEVISAIHNAYSQMGEKAKGDSLEKQLVSKYPHSDIAMFHLYRQAVKQKDKDEQAQMLKKYINASYEQSYINKYYTGVACRKLFKYYAKKDSLKQMKRIAGLWLQPNPRIMKNPQKAKDYNGAAEILAENTNRYGWGKKLAEKALELSKTEPAARGFGLSKYGIMLVKTPENKKEEFRNKRKATILATLGLIYTKQKSYKKAEKTLEKAKSLSKGNKDVNNYLADLYKQTKRPKKAFGIYRDMVMEKPLDKDLQGKLKESYIAYNGSEEGFEKQTEAIDRQWHQKMTKKFKKKLLNKDAPSLAHAKDLDGAPLDTTKLAGKVVVLDFWATWCGPCNRAFPHMQKVYEQFKDNPRVQFIILDSGWSNTVKQAKKWQRKHDYTFPLYFDHDSKITGAYGVTGIPTTFVLEGNSKIRFKEIGYSGPAMEKTLPMKIKMVLNGVDNIASSEGS